jgi:ribosomal protein L11 methylase PrmA
MSVWLVVLILGGVGVVTLILFFYATFGLMFVFGAPWVPTSPKVARAMLELAGLKRNETLLDLGCGHGVISILAAKEIDAKGIGLDIHPGLVWWARWRALIRGVRHRTSFRRANLLKTTLPKVDVVSIYLLDGLMNELRDILVRDLNPGTRIVSHGFAFKDIEPHRTVRLDKKQLYLYQVQDLKR